MIETFITDAGRSSSGMQNENNDCTVRALANTARMSYVEAHIACEEHGRRQYRKGMVNSQINDMLSVLKQRGRLDFEYIAPSEYTRIEKKMTVRFSRRRNAFVHRMRSRRVGGETAEHFLARLPKVGRFYVITTHHAFAYIDGVVYDTGKSWGSRAKMICGYAIKPEKPSITQDQINELWARLDKLEGK